MLAYVAVMGVLTTAQRFLEEAKITGQLQHPGIPAVYRVGWLADGRPFVRDRVERHVERAVGELQDDVAGLAKILPAGRQ